MNTCPVCQKVCVRTYCSRSCSAIINSGKRKKARPVCVECGEPTKRMASSFYCSRKCQLDFQYKKFIESWKSGEESGVVGSTGTSNHIKRYLRETSGNRCQKCGWCEINPTSGKVPVQLEHSDGNWKNNSEENLLLLCPNCHSLTSTFGGLNKGHGRKERYK